MTNATARLGFTLASLLALACGGGGGPPPEIPQADACPQASTAICSKIFSCPSDDLILGSVQTALGGSDANCRATITQNYCGGLACSAAQSYHGDKAYQCKTQFGQVSCSDIGGALFRSGGDVMVLIGDLAPACNQVCTTP